MRKKRFTVKQIVLRQVEVGVANGKTLLLITQEDLLIGHTQ
jgi:hypothetical protein